METIIASFRDSVERLREILREPKTVANRDSAIKRFELTFELAWKSIQKFMQREGLLCRSPRESFRAAFKYGLMTDDERWLEMLEDRNQTVHTYSEKLADQVYERLPGYFELLSDLARRLSDMLKESKAE